VKAAILQAPRELKVIEMDDPVAGPDDIVVQVAAAGICGSDLTSYATGAYVRPGQVMGHEFSGAVVEVGRGVRGISVGARVTVRPLAQCGRCGACERGLRHVCERAVRDAIGYGHPGAFAEFVRVPRAVIGDNVHLLATTTSNSAAAMVEVFAVATHAVRRLGVAAGDSCVILGLGPVGIAAVQVLRADGVHAVVGIDASKVRRHMARQHGAHIVSDSDGMVDAVRSVAGAGPRGDNAGADAVLEASGSATLAEAAPTLIRSGGRLTLVALYKERPVFDIDEIVTREIEVRGCYGYDDEFARALELVANDRVDAAAMVTASYPLDQIGKAFAAQADASAHVKVQVVFDTSLPH
jgi:threonine dehydrogenase-like Zn-dependent dehydrogenase